MKISWTPPIPRSGIKGAIDKFIGPGTTNGEYWLQFAAIVVGTLAAPGVAAWKGLDWSTWQFIVAGLLSFDLFGGVVTNATSAAKRWYHRPEQGWKAHMVFVALHLHPFLVAWLFLDGNWTFGIVGYGYLMMAALLILWMPLYLKRPFAMLLYLFGVFISLYTLPTVPGMEWFLPIFYLKLLVSHLLKEAPFQPEA